MDRKIYVVDGGTGYANWMQGKLVKDMREADLVVFTGGSDISPSLYGEPMGKFTYVNAERDKREVKEWYKAIALEKPIIGICRGAQLACALSGGRLIQHQMDDHFMHEIITPDGKIPMSSMHHQAQFPYEMPEENYKVLGWTNGLSKFHLNGLNVEISEKDFPETEIVYYPKTRSLGIQGHPEVISEKQYPQTMEWLCHLLDRHMKNEI